MHLARTAPLALLVGLAACGSSSAQVVTSRPTAKTAAATATAAPAQAGATAKRVSIKNFEFSPKTLTVAKGTKVTWTNKDSANHTVTFKKGPATSATSTTTGRRARRSRRPGASPTCASTTRTCMAPSS